MRNLNKIVVNKEESNNQGMNVNCFAFALQTILLSVKLTKLTLNCVCFWCIPCVGVCEGLLSNRVDLLEMILDFGVVGGD